MQKRNKKNKKRKWNFFGELVSYEFIFKVIEPSLESIILFTALGLNYNIVCLIFTDWPKILALIQKFLFRFF